MGAVRCSIVALAALGLLWIPTALAADLYVPTQYSTIQAAINAAQPGDTIYVAAGTYTESLGGWRDIEIFKSVNIIGAGSGQTIVQLSNKTNGVEIRPNATVVLIQGITFTKRPDQPYSAGFAIRLGETGGTFQSVTFRDVEVAYASGRNIFFDSGGGGATYNSIVMENCNVHHSGSWGCSIRGTVGTVTITNCNFDYNGQVDPGHGIGLDFEAPTITGSVTVTGGTMNYNKSKGVNMTGVRNVTFNGVTFRWNSGASSAFGACLWEYTGSSQNIKFINCVLRQNGTDGLLIGVEGGKTVDGVEVIGGELRGNPRAGVNVYVDSGTIKNVRICGAFIAGNGQDGVLTNTPDIVDARFNWWNTITGPGGGALDPVTGKPANGTGNRVTGNVRFDPWLVQLTPPVVLGSGDANLDGVVNILDVELVYKAALGLVTLTPAQAAAADVDGVPGISLADAQKIAQALITCPWGLPTCPCCP